IIDKLFHLFLITLKNANCTHSEKNYLAPSWVMKMFPDEIVAIFPLLQFASGKIFFKSEMEESIAFLTTFDQNARFTTYRLQKLLCHFLGFVFSNTSRNQLLNDVIIYLFSRNGSNGGMFMHPERQRTQDFNEFVFSKIDFLSFRPYPGVDECQNTQVKKINTVTR